MKSGLRKAESQRAGVAGVTVRQHIRDSVAVVALSGVLDERFDGARLTDSGTPFIVLDLEGVERITSFGVREWMRALQAIDAELLCFINCPPCMLIQFNMIRGFGGRGRLVSFYAPYVCPRCEAELYRHVDLREQYDLITASTPPPVKCPDCDVDAEFDDLSERYFSYAASRPSPALPAVVSRALDEPRTRAPVLGVEKELHGEVTALWLFGELDENARLRRVFQDLDVHAIVVVEGIVVASAAGAARLVQDLERAAVSVHVARIPQSLARLLPTESRARFWSIIGEVRCSTCDEVSETEVSRPLLMGEPAGSFSCRYCGSQELPRIDPALRERYHHFLSAEEPSAPVLRYLERRRPGYAPWKSSMGQPRVEDEVAPKIHAGPSRAYTSLRRLGVGGMAEVFLARHVGEAGFAKMVVIKRMLPSVAKSPLMREMFLAEARLAGSIVHPNIVQISDLVLDPQAPFIVMEYVDGWDLREILDMLHSTEQKMPIGLACRILADVCGGLQAAHRSTGPEGQRLCVVHRDVSPRNILISSSGAVKLTDFGIAKALQAGHYQITEPGVLKGKLAYMAPEQYDPSGYVDGRTDQFSAALVLLECLTLRPPPLLRAGKDRGGDPSPALVKLGERSDVPEQLVATLARALSMNADDRFPGASDFQRELLLVAERNGGAPTTVHLADWLGELNTRWSAQGDAPLPSTVPTKVGIETQRLTAQLEAEDVMIKPILEGPAVGRAPSQEESG